MPPRHPSIAHAVGVVRRRLASLGADPAGRRVHVACSGGADSVALLGVLHLLAPGDALVLSVGTVDHGLRDAAADEARTVASIAASMSLPCEVTRLGLEPGPGLPARARDARRAALRSQAARHGAIAIALGHTATDQAETVLLHLSRGAGLEGLAAMAEHEPFDDGTPGGWRRPLLDLDRAQTRELAQRLQLPFHDDPTNDDPRHPRVAVRHEVLATLRAKNPRVEHAIARAAEHARAAEQALQVWVDRELVARQRGPDPHAILGSGATAPSAPSHAPPHELRPPDVTSGARWSTVGMEQLPSAVRTRFVRRILRASGSPDDALSSRTLASIDDALGQPGPARSWDLHPQLRLFVVHGTLWIEPAMPRASRGQPLTP